MLITKIALENFKSYAKTDIRFLEGTNAIIGANGAGKSSILEAIGFALFDYRPPGSRLADLLREGATSGSVAVTFVSSYDQRDYEVERAFNERTTTRYRAYDLDRGRQVLAEGGEEMGKWLHEHLQVDDGASLNDLFENTIGVPQGTFTAPFLQSAGVRKGIFDPLLKVDEYRRASDRLLDSVHHLDKQEQATSERIANLRGQLEQLPRLQKERQELETERASAEVHLKELHTRQGELEEELEVMEEAQRALELANLALTRAQSRQEQLQSQREQALLRLREAQEAEARVKECSDDHRLYLEAEKRLETLETARHARDELSNRLTNAEKSMTELGTRLQGTEAQRHEAQQAAQRALALEPQARDQQALLERRSELQKAALSAQNLRERVAESQAERQEMREHLKGIRQELQWAADCRQDLEALEKKLGEAQQEEREWDRRRATAESELQRLEEQSEMLQHSKAATCPTCEQPLTEKHRRQILERNREEADRLSQTVAQARQHLSALGQHQQDMREESEGLRELIESYHHESDLERAREGLANCEATLEERRKELEALGQPGEELEQVEDALEELGDPAAEYRLYLDKADQLAELKAACDQLSRQVEGLKNRCRQLRDQLAPYDDLDQKLSTARQQRARHQEGHEAYLRNHTLAEQREERRNALIQAEKELADHQEILRERERATQKARGRYDRERHADLRVQTQRTGNEASELSGKLDSMTRRLRVVQKELERLAGLATDLDRQEKKLARLGRLLALLDRVRSLLREAGPYVTRRMVARISNQASRLYAEIMGDHRKRLNWSEDYELSLEAKGRKRVFHQLSGGEQMSAALALRLALLRETSSVDVAFFDEPTAHLDPTRRDGLADQIVQVKGFSQIFVISHDDTFEQAAQNYVHIVKDENGSRQE